MLSNIMDTDAGKIIISVIIGLGLASFFKKVCKNGKCVVIKGPDVNEVKKHVYKIDNECFQYTPTMTKCKET